MANSLPTNDGKIYNLATKNYNGVVKYGAAIPITMITAAILLASKTAFKSAADDFNAARSDLRDAYKVYKPAMAALLVFLLAARRSLVGILGVPWSAAWVQAGFINNSTAVPKDNEAQIALGLALETYYTNNPSSERPDDGVTAAQAASLTTAATAAQTGVLTKEEAVRVADHVRQPAKATLLGNMSSLIMNLDDKLAADDPRWLAFGLQMPATPTTPGQVQNVTVSLTEDGGILVQGNPEPLASRYRGRMMILGVDMKYRLVFSGTAPMGMIEGVQPGATVQIIMQAVNGTSQGVASEPVIFTVPVVPPVSDGAVKTAATAKLVTAIEPAPVAGAAVNGKANGNGKAPVALSRLS